nr:NUMOD3 domain-containing DNA-binding protein [Coprothermobacter proteolyticus]
LDGGRCSDESIKKISKSAKGRIPWNKGIPRTDEVKRKLSESKKGKPGRVQSEAEKEKRRHPITQEHKDNIAAAKLGKKRTIEERKAISEGIARAKLKKIVDFYLEDDSDD